MSWRDLFVGRRAELDWLKERWAKALEGEPQLVVLLAETGLGKTRIAQEFYRWLSREQDAAGGDHPQGYWPDAFGSDRESLDVNPSFDPGAGTKAEIPWLWWGLRWENPGNRNQIDDRCALSTFRSALQPHIQAIETKIKLRHIKYKAMYKVGELGASVTPAALLTAPASKLKDVWELWNDWRDTRKLNKENTLDTGSIQRTQEIQLKDLVLLYFRTVLDPSASDAPTVPVILLLDDAQWADSTSLAFVRELFAEALRKRWKLMVILTHWEQEWNVGPVAIDPKDGSITHARQLPVELKLAESWQTDCVRIVHPLPEAEEIVRYAFPGLTESQRKLVVEKSGGNAEMLKEALLWFESEPRFFVRNDRNQPLSEVGEKRLAEREFELAQFIRKRYERLSEKVRRSLGWSSAQGTRFLAEMTRAAAELMIRSDPDKYEGQIQAGEVIDALSQAEHPHSWIGFAGDRARQNLATFRQRVFWEIANDDLGFDPDERSRLESAIREVLTNWFENGKIDTLPSAERLDTLLIARRMLRPTEVEAESAWKVWSRMMVRLFQEYRSEFLDQQALGIAQEWFDARPSGGWKFDCVPFWDQFDILRLLELWQDRSRRRLFLQELTANCRKMTDSPQSSEKNRYLAATLLVEGYIHSSEGNLRAARVSLWMSLRLHRRICADEGPSLAALRDLGFSLAELGFIVYSVGKRKTARSYIEESLENRRRILTVYGLSPDALSNLSVSLNMLGDIDRDEYDHAAARASYQESLENCRRIRSDYGSSLKALRDLSVALDRVGDIARMTGDLDYARECFKESLALRRQIMADYGSTPVTMRDLSVSLDQVGEIELSDGEFESARTVFQESLKIRREILDTYGQSREILRDLSVSLEKVGDAAKMVGDTAKESENEAFARDSYLESLKIRREIRDNFGQSPETLRDLSVSLNRVGDIHKSRDLEFARKSFTESLEIRRKIMADYGSSPRALQDLSVSLEILTQIDQDYRQLDATREEYEIRRDAIRDILKYYGPNLEIMLDLTDSLWTVADFERDEGRPDAARKSYEESRENCLQAQNDFSSSQDAKNYLLGSELKLVQFELSVDKIDDARKWLESAKIRLQEMQLSGLPAKLRASFEEVVKEFEEEIRRKSS